MPYRIVPWPERNIEWRNPPQQLYYGLDCARRAIAASEGVIDQDQTHYSIGERDGRWWKVRWRPRGSGFSTSWCGWIEQLTPEGGDPDTRP